MNAPDPDSLEGPPDVGPDSDLAERAVPEKMVEQWQRSIDTAADVLDVPAGLIMQVDCPYIEVFRASETEANPCEVGDREQLTGLYCEAVIESGEKLHVPYVQDTERWRDNPDVVEYGLSAYLGLPIKWPDGAVFGTIYVLDSEESELPDSSPQLLRQFKSMIEGDLESIVRQRERERQKKKKLIHFGRHGKPTKTCFTASTTPCSFTTSKA